MLYDLLAHAAQHPATRDLSPASVDALLEAVSFAGEHVAWPESLGDARTLRDQVDRLGPAWKDVDGVIRALEGHLETHGGYLSLDDDEPDDEPGGAAVIARIAAAIPASAASATIALVARAGWDSESGELAWGTDALIEALGRALAVPDPAQVAQDAVDSPPAFVFNAAFQGYRTLDAIPAPDREAATARALRRLGVPAPDPAPDLVGPPHTMLCVVSGYYGALVVYQLPPEHRSPALDRGLGRLAGTAMRTRLDLADGDWPDVCRVLIALGWGLRDADQAFAVHVEAHLPHLSAADRAAMPDRAEVDVLAGLWNHDRVAWIEADAADLDPPFLQVPLDRVVATRLD